MYRYKTFAFVTKIKIVPFIKVLYIFHVYEEYFLVKSLTQLQHSRWILSHFRNLLRGNGFSIDLRLMGFDGNMTEISEK